MRSVLNSSRSAASCHARSSKESAAPAGGPPEFVISRSMPPNRSADDLIHASMPSADRTSSAVARTVAPVSRSIREAASRTAVSSRDAIDTCAPSAAIARATAYPSPLLAPATSATLPVRPRSMQRLRVLHHAIERVARCLIERRARRARGWTGEDAAAVQDFLADGHPDPFLEFEPHEWHRAVEHVCGIVHAARAIQRHDLHEDFREREPGHRACRARHQLLEKEHTAETAEDPDGNLALLEDA